MDNRLKTIGKTDDELRVGNYLVLFGGRDLEDEFFSPDTDFDSSYTKTGQLLVDWEHGIGRKMDGDGSPGRDDVLGFVDWKTARKDERGLWAERVLDRRNAYMQFIETLIDEGMVGTSSEAAEGVEKTKKGEIKRWPLKRDSLTVQPAEPRMMTENAISALKSLAEAYPSMKALLKGVDGTEAEASADSVKKQQITVTKESKMSDEIILQVPESKYAQILEERAGAMLENKATDEKVKTVQEQVSTLSSAVAEYNEKLDKVIEFIQTAPGDHKGKFVAPDSEEDHEDAKSFGDFLVAVRLNNKKRLKEVYGSEWTDDPDGMRGLSKSNKAALAEASGATGGYLVPTEFSAAIQGQYENRVILRQAGATVVPMASRSREVPAVNIETAPSAGSTSFAGGVVGYWTAEAGAITESEPTFNMIELVAHKLAAYSLASNEVRDDAAESVDGLLASMFAREFASQENYAFLRGDGVGKPLGILTSGAWSAQTRSAASTIALADLATMEGAFISDVAEGVYIVNHNAFKELVELVSNPLAYLNSANEQIPMRLLGRPVFRTGALPALNTAGDIMLVDPSYYLIGDRAGFAVAFSEHFKFQNDQVAWRAIKRVDGQPWVDSTITLENASTTVSPFVGLAAG